MLSLPRFQTTPSQGKFALRAERRKGAQATRRHLFSVFFSWPLALRDELLARFPTKVRYDALNCGSRQVHSGRQAGIVDSSPLKRVNANKLTYMELLRPFT